VPIVTTHHRPIVWLGRPMEKTLAYAISFVIIGFGAWIFVAGLYSAAPASWALVALIPIAIGLLSAFGDY